MTEYTWKPFKKHISLVPLNLLGIAVSVFLISTVFSGDAPMTPALIKNLVFFSLFGLLNAILCCYMLLKHTQTLVFTEAAVTVQSKKDSTAKEWSSLPWAYIISNAKSQRFLILSPDSLTKDEAKKLLRKNDITLNKVIMDDKVIFPVDDDALRAIRALAADTVTFITL